MKLQNRTTVDHFPRPGRDEWEEEQPSVERAGRKRLYPSLTDPNWLVLRRRRDIFKSWISRLDGRALDVLDVGGRVQPYRPLLEGRLRRYVAIDLQQTCLVDVVSRGEQIPLACEAFDLVICTQVLEYVPEPDKVIAEIHRVLKPGGTLLVSAPAIFPRESNRDIWRFSPESLKILLRPFREVEVVPEGASVSGFFRTICICLIMFFRQALIRGCLQFTVIPALNLIAASWEWLDQTSNDQFAANFSAIARK